MSDRARLLLARLTPSGPDPTRPVGTGGPTFTPADVAAALGFVTYRGPGGERIPDRVAQALLLYLWAGHDGPRDRERTLLLLALEATGWLEPAWKPRAPGQLRRLVGVALDERTGARVCRTCAGEGSVLVRGAPVECEACGGRGFHPWGTRTLASRFGTDRNTWRTYWGGRYARVAQMMAAVEERGLRQVARALAR